MMVTGDRRPIASRNSPLAKTIACWLAARGVSPNAISLGGMAAGVLAGCALAATRQPELSAIGFVLAAILVQVRLLANMFDGMVAIEQQQTSKIGELFNEVPDRVSDAAILIGAGYALGGEPMIGFVATCLALFIAYLRAQGAVAGAPQEFCGPMAKQQRMFVITLAALYAGCAPAAWQPALAGRVEFGTMTLALSLIVVGGIITVFRRLARITHSLQSRTV